MPNPVVSYYSSLESRLGYRYLKGVKHFGYYPEGKENLSKHQAQLLMNEQLAQQLNLSRGAKVLDAGCGEGNVSFYLTKRHHLKAYGIDLLDFNIRRAQKSARSLNMPNDSFIRGSYQQLPYKDATFDGAYTMETLVHSPDYKVALNELYRVLKPGGKLVLFEYTIKPEQRLTPSEVRAMTRLKQVNDVASMPAFNTFTFGSMPQKLSESGFETVTNIDITDRIMPMLRKFYSKARIPYKMSRYLRLQNHIINAMSAVEFYENQGLWRYEITTAHKPMSGRKA